VTGHRYSSDLNLFGEGSLFERLCTARTHLGRERLADYIKEPVTNEEALQRQASVRELTARTDLREQIALLGKYDFLESKWQTFADWLDAPSANLAGHLRPVLLVSGAQTATADHRDGLCRSTQWLRPLDRTSGSRRSGQATSDPSHWARDYPRFAPTPRLEAVAGKKCGACPS
jgi:hypothetical protein